MKKILIICLMACMLVSCRNVDKRVTRSVNNKISNEVINLNLWHYYLGENKKQLEDLVDEFNATVGAEEGILVKSEAKGKVIDLEKSVTNSMLGLIDSESEPDIFSSYPDKALEIKEMGKLSDISDYLSEDEKALYVDAFLQDGRIGNDEGEILILPVAKSTEVFYMNSTYYEDYLKNSGDKPLDLTKWENIYKTARNYYNYTDSLTEDIKGDGKSFMGFDAITNYMVISTRQLNEPIMDEDRRCARLNKEVLRKAFDNYFKGSILGYYSAYGRFRTDDIKSSKLIAFVGSSSGAIYFPDWVDDDGRQVPISSKILKYPAFKKSEPVTIRQGAGMCVTKSNPNRERAAVTFLKWFTKKENNLSFVGDSGYLPVVRGAYDDGAFALSLDNADNDEAKIFSKVHAVSAKQILNNQTYSVKPFEGSYEIRNILASRLEKSVQDNLQQAKDLRKKGKSEEEILKEIDVDKVFQKWLDNVVADLESKEIAYYNE